MCSSCVYTKEYYITAAPNGPPVSVIASAITVSTITVTWSPPDLALQNGRITSYKLLYTNDTSQSDDLRQSVTINATSLSYQLTNLLVNTRYYIKIAAATSVGLGPYTNTLTAIIRELVNCYDYDPKHHFSFFSFTFSNYYSYCWTFSNY